jgi:hypothetical protein
MPYGNAHIIYYQGKNILSLYDRLPQTSTCHTLIRHHMSSPDWLHSCHVSLLVSCHVS